MKGFMAHIYRQFDGATGVLLDCTNNGTTGSKYIYAVCIVGALAQSMGLPEIHESGGNLPTMFLRKFFDHQNRERFYLVPLELYNRTTHPGGNFAYSSDSRWTKIFPYPLPIHDRVE